MGRDATPSVQQELITLIKNQEIVAAAVLSLTSCKLRTMESARAKIQANNSPRSSPDEQGSPRIQRSISQAQQRVNGNGTQHVHGFVCCKQWRRGTRHSFRRLTASICYGNCYFFFQRVNFFNF
ncbi:hypothetical protein ACOSQ3_011532 [Xanthoceras sorbifolium]